MNDRACPRDGVRPVGHVGSRPQGEVPRAAWAYLESLEARLLLSGETAQQALELFSVSPALFVENQGQWADPSVRYVHHGSGVNVAMTDAGPVFQLFRDDPADPNGASDPPADRIDPEAHNTQVLQFSASFVGAAGVVPVGVNRSDALFNYFLGDQSSWRSNVPGYEQVAYQGLYPGVDLLAQGLRSHLKYEFHVAPGADWSQIVVRYEGIAGLALAQDGSLRVSLGGLWGEVLDDAPYAYQVIGDQRVAVAASFAILDGTTYGFSITGAYDPTRELVIDPDLAYCTYLGRGGDDYGRGIAVDGSGNVYVTGITTSTGLATAGAYRTTYGGGMYDAFVAKFNSTGSGLVYCTYLGGSGDDYGSRIAVDGSGNAYVTGITSSSTGLATAGAYRTTYGGTYDAFVGKLNSTGSGLVYCTYLGGGGADYGLGIAVDGSGSAYVTGWTSSSGLATAGAYQTTYGGDSWDAFVAKFNSTGSGLVYCTYLGGGGNDQGYRIAVDGSGSAYVTGNTTSTGLATGGAYQTTYGGGYDAFVAKFNSAGSGLAYCTYLGGGGEDYGYGIAVDGSGSSYVTGYTNSSGLATAGAYQTTYGGGTGIGDAFVAKMALFVTPPVVTKVLVCGTSWGSSFLDFLQSSGLGTGGYAIPVGSGVQLKPLPWVNIDQVKVVFSEDVLVDTGDLFLGGINVASYGMDLFWYDAGTFTATWTLSAAIGTDKLLIELNADGPDPIRDAAGNALDGEWTNPTSKSTPSSSVFPSGNGTAGGNFGFRFNVLPGDVNQNTVVQSNDGLMVRAALGTSTVSGGLYSPFKDINANSIIQSNDGLSVRSRLGTSLPAGEPVSGMGGMSAPLSEAGGAPAPLSEVGESAQPTPTPSAVTSPAASPRKPIPTSNLSGPAASGTSTSAPTSNLSGSGAFDVLAAAAPVGGRPRRASSVSASASNAGAASGLLVDTSTPISDSLYDLEGNRRGAGLIRSLICSGR